MPRDPIIHNDGIGSERHAQTNRIQVVFRCPDCNFHSGAEGEHIPWPRDAPEFRTLAAWQQAARAKEARDRFAFYSARARRDYDAHVCAAATTVAT